MLFMAASSKNKSAAQTALMVQLINTAFAMYEMHAQSVRTREAQRIRSVVEVPLAPFTATMPKAVWWVPLQQPAPDAAVVPRAIVSPGAEGWYPSVRDQRCQRRRPRRRHPSPADATPGRASTDDHHQLQGEQHE